MFLQYMWLLYSDKPLDLDDVGMAPTSYGTYLHLLLYVIILIVFSICDRSKVDFNYFTKTSYSLERLQEQSSKHTNHKDKDGEIL